MNGGGTGARGPARPARRPEGISCSPQPPSLSSHCFASALPSRSAYTFPSHSSAHISLLSLYISVSLAFSLSLSLSLTHTHSLSLRLPLLYGGGGTPATGRAGRAPAPWPPWCSSAAPAAIKRRAALLSPCNGRRRQPESAVGPRGGLPMAGGRLRDQIACAGTAGLTRRFHSSQIYRQPRGSGAPR